jgi:integrase
MTESNDKYKLEPVTTKRDGKIKNLYTRNGTYYLVAQVNGKRHLRACPYETLKEAKTWVKSFIRNERDGRGEINEHTKARTSFATIGEIIDVYKAVAERRGHPSADTVKGNVQRLKKVLSRGAGVVNPEAMRSDVALTAAVVNQYADGELAACKSELEKETKRRTIATALRCSRALFAKKMMQEYDSLQLPDITDFKTRWVVEARIKRYTVPHAFEIDPVLKAGRALGDDLETAEQRDLYVTFCLAYYLGMRAGEIAACKWSWIHEDENGVTVMDLHNKPEEGFRAKGREGAVPIHEDLLALLLKCRQPGHDAMLSKGTVKARRDFIVRQFSAWMKGLGWQRAEAAHELRKLRGHKWKQAYGISTAHDWLRHAAMQTTIDYYSDNKNERVPMALD